MGQVSQPAGLPPLAHEHWARHVLQVELVLQFTPQPLSAGAYEQAKVSCLVDEGVDDEHGRRFFTRTEGDGWAKVTPMSPRSMTEPLTEVFAKVTSMSPRLMAEPCAEVMAKVTSMLPMLMAKPLVEVWVSPSFLYLRHSCTFKLLISNQFVVKELGDC